MLRKIIVTGSNKGIGYGIVEDLAAKQGWHVIMACRNLALAEEARNNIKAKFPASSIDIEQLDVSSNESILKFIEVIKQKYHKVDVIINNAGVAAKGDEFDIDIINWTFATNFYGTATLSKEILPFIVDKGKIITVGSMVSRMTYNKITNEELKKKWSDPNLTEAGVYHLLKEYEEGVKKGDYLEKGWPKWGYGVSKLGIVEFTRKFAKRPEVVDRGIQVYSCCPGYVATDMTSHKGTKTIQEGIVCPMFLFNLPFVLDPQIQGQFFTECKVGVVTD